MKTLIVCALVLCSTTLIAAPKRWLAVETRIKTGTHPVDLVWHADGKGLFVSLQASGQLLEFRHRKIVRRVKIAALLSGLALT